MNLFSTDTNRLSACELLWEKQLPSGRVIQVVQGDITQEEVDAIVNAANEHLMHGGGVAGAIRRQGGSIIQQESSDWVRHHGRVITGSAAITNGGHLPATWVIHAVGPMWGSGNEELKLFSAIDSALHLADAERVRTISIPGISSGIFGGPKDICATTIIKSTLAYLTEHPQSYLQTIRFCNIDTETAVAFYQAAQTLLNE